VKIELHREPIWPPGTTCCSSAHPRVVAAWIQDIGKSMPLGLAKRITTMDSSAGGYVLGDERVTGVHSRYTLEV